MKEKKTEEVYDVYCEDEDDFFNYKEKIEEPKKKKVTKKKSVKKKKVSKPKKIQLKEQPEKTLAEQILDRWGTQVIHMDSIYINVDGVAMLKQKEVPPRNYEEGGFDKDFVLWIPPRDCLRLEFEAEPKQNKRWIREIESSAKSLGYDYCISCHGGKSEYFNMFNIQLPKNANSEDYKIVKLKIIDTLIPESARNSLDETNIKWTYSPIIDRPHWKPKYKGAIHKITRGKNPLEHQNKIDKDILNEIKKTKTKLKKNYLNIRQNEDSSWVEDFLLNYCCNNELPKGNRHFIIEKNLSAFILHRPDKEIIEQAYLKAQSRHSNTLNSWYLAILGGKYTEVSTGEIVNYIKKYHTIKYEIPKPKPQQKTKEYIDWGKLSKKELIPKVMEFLALKKSSSATEAIVQYILANKKIYTIRSVKEPEMWIYHDGIYISKGKTYLQEECRDILGKTYTTHLFNNIILKIQADTFTEADDFFLNETIEEIAIENGILNIFTKKLRDFNSNDIFFNKLPINFDKTQKCPNIIKHFEQILPNKSDIDLMFEIIGFCLLKEYRFEKAFLFNGFGRNGKSKSCELIKLFLGSENCVNIPIQRFENDKYALGEIHGKLANLGADISPEELKTTSIFKSMTGRDAQTAPRKWVGDLNFNPYCKHIFSANELPYIYDSSYAFWARWVYLEFPYKFLTQKEIDDLPLDKKEFVKLRDPNIIQKISTSEELSGLLNSALKGLNRLIKNKDFSTSFSQEEIKRKWIAKSNSFKSFASESLILNYNSSISADEMRERYSQYCQKNKLRGVSDKIIKYVMNTDFIAEKRRVLQNDGTQKFRWLGVKFKEKEHISLAGVAGVAGGFDSLTKFVNSSGVQKPMKPMQPMQPKIIEEKVE